jgi:hypothetical protein
MTGSMGIRETGCVAMLILQKKPLPWGLIGQMNPVNPLKVKRGLAGVLCMRSFPPVGVGPRDSGKGRRLV